jgi:hypothetical protein
VYENKRDSLLVERLSDFQEYQWYLIAGESLFVRSAGRPGGEAI